MASFSIRLPIRFPMSLLLARHKSLYGVLRVVPLFRHIGWLSQLSKLVPVSLLKVLDPGVAGFRIFTMVSLINYVRLGKTVFANTIRSGRGRLTRSGLRWLRKARKVTAKRSNQFSMTSSAVIYPSRRKTLVVSRGKRLLSSLREQ